VLTHPGWEDWRIVAPTGEASASLAEKKARARRRRRRRLRRRIFRTVRWSLLAVGIFFVAVCGWVAWDARGVQDDLQTAASAMGTLQEEVLAGDTAAVQAAVSTVQQSSGDAARVSGRPHWAIATVLPWIGPNVAAVSQVATAVDDIAQGALPDLQVAVDTLNPAALAPVGGVIDLAPLTESAPAVIAVDAVMQDALARLVDIDRGQLLPVVAEAVDQATGELESASAQTRTAARVVRLLPPMLGADGPRDYLLLVQNNAEQRATGGIPGLVLQIHVEDGRLEIVDERSALEVGSFPEPVLELSETETTLFGAQLGRYMQDVTFTPDFPRTGELASAMWLQRFGVAVDGVLSVDPVALQAMLGVTGPLMVDGVSLTETDAAATLLNGIYLDRPDPQAQDAFFAAAASEIFESVTSGAGDASAAIEVLADQAGDRRLLLWSAHPEEQAHLTGTVLAGDLIGQSGDRPVVGVFINDGSAAKIGYYLDTRVSLESLECRPDGSQTMSVHLTLSSTVSEDEIGSLPSYVTGDGDGYVEPGHQQLNVLVYAPEGGAITSFDAGDGEGVLSQVHDGLPVIARTVTIAPGESFEAEIELRSGPGGSGDTDLRVTPGPRPAALETTASSCMGGA